MDTYLKAAITRDFHQSLDAIEEFQPLECTCPDENTDWQDECDACAAVFNELASATVRHFSARGRRTRFTRWHGRHSAKHPF